MTPDAQIPPRYPRPATRDDVARAKAGYESGYGVDHVIVSEWLRTWGQPGFKDFPLWLAEQNE
ncbi:hypothetical protein [Sphingomonas sp. CV7422]|uniref:hypothetical protein n=1 Tax=Sphingomonas sp. CV7422 TaxID=3018036 RepID=UPI00044E1A8A|nr:hypothetical protein [Sphingomonas sp. CV7422]EZP52540.1 hypothetical protein BW41_02300 [Sphingomonas sp. RIT328]